MLPQGYPWATSKLFSQFGSAVWSAISNIFMSEELYYYLISRILSFRFYQIKNQSQSGPTKKEAFLIPPFCKTMF